MNPEGPSKEVSPRGSGHGEKRDDRMGGLPKRLAACGVDWDGVSAERMRQVDSLTGWTMRGVGSENVIMD